MAPIASLRHLALLSSSAAVIVFASACQDADQPTAPQIGTPTFSIAASQEADVIPGHYIVVFNESVKDPGDPDGNRVATSRSGNTWRIEGSAGVHCNSGPKKRGRRTLTEVGQAEGFLMELTAP